METTVFGLPSGKTKGPLSLRERDRERGKAEFIVLLSLVVSNTE